MKAKTVSNLKKKYYGFACNKRTKPKFVQLVLSFIFSDISAPGPTTTEEDPFDGFELVEEEDDGEEEGVRPKRRLSSSIAEKLKVFGGKGNFFQVYLLCLVVTTTT